MKKEQKGQYFKISVLGVFLVDSRLTPLEALRVENYYYDPVNNKLSIYVRRPRKRRIK